ncbi:hypothetical protein CVT26_006334 [Gymnopilus dilepis]|uniref:PH domain-containing protein n=1 Tax=Gymnopilus dilepis TaxID=231916 RepID=A0A409Y0M1_9AGAR|nr:hypothetical protein CVT26_006334 [Gymnopilus dilepis]
MNTNTNAPSDHRPLSRSTSRASSRTRGSTLSRQQSLIKKNIELQDLKPADVLIERFVAWKAIVKQLTAYFEGIADIENNTAKELTKLAGVIQVPFRAGNQFLGEGGLQDIYYDIRDKTRIIADQHADLGRTIDSSIVQHLNKLRAEIKAHIKNVQNDTGKLAASVARERELSTKLVGELANAVSTLTNTPGAIHARNDPYIANQAVARQLQHQVHEENMLQKSIVIMQQNSAHFEEGIVQSIQSAWQTFDEWQSRASAASQEVFRALAQHMASLRPDHEWIQFAARSDHLLDPETPLRDPAYINYPLKDHHSTKPIHVGHLERKKRFTRAYHEAYFVLTPAGFLHEFASSDPTTHAGQTPTFSLYLPTCTLGPASSPRAKAHKFHIEGRKDGVGATKTKTGSFRGLLGGQGSLAWSFRARSHEDMLEWWNDVRELCARYLVASEQVDRTGPVEEAVRSVGYLSEEEEELEDEEEEEEEEVATADEGEGDVEAAPGPAKQHRGRLLEVHDAHAERAARARGMEGPAPVPAPAQAAEPHEEDAEPEHEGSSVEEEVDEHEHEHDHPHAAPGPEPSLAGHAPVEHDQEHDQEHEHEHEHEREEPPVYAAEKGYQHQLLNGKGGGGGGGGGVEVEPNAYAVRS